MNSNLMRKNNPTKHYFPLPNQIFSLELTPGELAVYSFLMCCENRKTYQCWPSYATIGKAVGMSTNTVRKYVCQLVEKSFIQTDTTKVMTKDGMKRNGSLLYTILPIQHAVDAYNQRMVEEAEKENKKRQMQAT